MTHLPFIIGYGGINAAGLSSTDQGYLNMVAAALDESQRAELLVSLKAMDNEKEDNNPVGETSDARLADVQKDFFIRTIPRHFFDLAATPYYKLDGKKEKFPVSFAACLPTHFNPELCYQSRYHPRGLQMAIFAANDALGSAGLDVYEIRGAIRADKCAVYAGSALGQIDKDSMGGLLTAALREKKTITKQLPFSYPQMPADFVNAYVLKNLGHTGNQCGACATFLYNLCHAVEQIKNGTIELALVGASEAPLVPQLIAAFHNMGALASDEKIGPLDPRKASIPFGNNYGFVLGESAQFVVLASEEAVCRLGACIYGMVSEVFINADGGKHSISAPGPGNYITMGKAAAALEKLHGQETLRRKSYIQAHGTSTMQNRVTESHIFSSVAQAFGVKDWPIVAIKSYLGHSQAAAGGDQLVNSLSFWHHGVLPGITTLMELAEDVVTDNLRFNLDHKHIGVAAMDAVLVNTKGFGGNNATAVVSSPQQAQALLEKKVGKKKRQEVAKKQEITRGKHKQYMAQAAKGRFSLRYDFEDAVLHKGDVRITRQGVQIKGYPYIDFDA